MTRTNTKTAENRVVIMTSRHEELLAKAARGLTPAQIELGHSCLTGKLDGQPFPQDFVEARRWFESAHERGAFTATVLLGSMYEEGKGVAVDVPKAVELYEMAAKRGAYLPCLYLARIFAHGRGVPVSPEKAVAWYRKVLANEGSVDDMGEMAEARGYLEGHSA